MAGRPTAGPAPVFWNGPAHRRAETSPSHIARREFLFPAARCPRLVSRGQPRIRYRAPMLRRAAIVWIVICAVLAAALLAAARASGPRGLRLTAEPGLPAGRLRPRRRPARPLHRRGADPPRGARALGRVLARRPRRTAPAGRAGARRRHGRGRRRDRAVGPARRPAEGALRAGRAACTRWRSSTCPPAGPEELRLRWSREDDLPRDLDADALYPQAPDARTVSVVARAAAPARRPRGGAAAVARPARRDDRLASGARRTLAVAGRLERRAEAARASGPADRGAGRRRPLRRRAPLRGARRALRVGGPGLGRGGGPRASSGRIPTRCAGSPRRRSRAAIPSTTSAARARCAGSTRPTCASRSSPRSRA